jgi:hypothetical protein
MIYKLLLEELLSSSDMMGGIVSLVTVVSRKMILFMTDWTRIATCFD